MDSSLSLDEIIKKKKIKPFKNQNNTTLKKNKGVGATVKRLGKNPPQKQLNTKKNIVTTKNKIVTDARNKIIQKKKQNIGDARDKLGQLARKGDARARLNQLKKGKQGVAATRIGGKGSPATLTTKKAALVKRQLGIGNIERKVKVNHSNLRRQGSQNYQQRPQNVRVQQVEYQPRPQPRAMRPEMIYDDYPQEQVQYVYPDMYDSYPQQQVIYRQPQPVMVRPAPVYRPSPVYVDEYDSPMPRRETVYVDERGVPVRTRQVYADAPLRRPAPVRVQRQQPMSSRVQQPMSARVTQQQRPQQKQQQRQPQQQARPQQQQGQKVLVNNLQSTVTAADMKEIFGTIGKVISSRLVKKGVAEAVFLKKQDALKFVEAFHNRLLDGQAMNAYLVKSK